MSESPTAIDPSLHADEPVPVSQRVVEAVAEAEGVDQFDLDPLYTAIDPDALDALFRPQRQAGEVPDASASVRFDYEGYEVRVTATGQVTLSE